jgi:hypothetical protein
VGRRRVGPHPEVRVIAADSQPRLSTLVMREPAPGRNVAAMFGSTGEAEVMTFLTRPGWRLHKARPWAHALATWRDTALLVRLRWDDFLAADRASRRGAFAAYVAALDAEAAAAGELAGAHPDLAKAA